MLKFYNKIIKIIFYFYLLFLVLLLIFIYISKRFYLILYIKDYLKFNDMLLNTRHINIPDLLLKIQKFIWVNSFLIIVVILILCFMIIFIYILNKIYNKIKYNTLYYLFQILILICAFIHFFIIIKIIFDNFFIFNFKPFFDNIIFTLYKVQTDEEILYYYKKHLTILYEKGDIPLKLIENVYNNINVFLINNKDIIYRINFKKLNEVVFKIICDEQEAYKRQCYDQSQIILNNEMKLIDDCINYGKNYSKNYSKNCSDYLFDKDLQKQIEEVNDIFLKNKLFERNQNIMNDSYYQKIMNDKMEEDIINYPFTYSSLDNYLNFFEIVKNFYFILPTISVILLIIIILCYKIKK